MTEQEWLVWLQACKDMKEQEWLACSDPYPMLTFLRDKGRARKLRLFACACCRRVWHLVENDLSRHAVEVAERFADGHISAEELDTIHSATHETALRLDWLEAGRNAGSAANRTVWTDARDAALRASEQASEAAGIAQLGPRGGSHPEVHAKYAAGLASEKDHQAVLLRHIIGNPFRPYPAPDHWPSSVIQLANALYNGEDCGFALQDALLEAGHSALADHFRQEQSHPKGCWAVDLILGKE